MIRDDEYALFALRTYMAEEANKPLVPEGWTQLGDDESGMDSPPAHT